MNVSLQCYCVWMISILLHMSPQFYFTFALFGACIGPYAGHSVVLISSCWEVSLSKEIFSFISSYTRQASWSVFLDEDPPDFLHEQHTQISTYLGRYYCMFKNGNNLNGVIIASRFSCAYYLSHDLDMTLYNLLSFIGLYYI